MKKFNEKEFEVEVKNELAKIENINADVGSGIEDIVFDYVISKILIVLLISTVVGLIFIWILKGTGHWISFEGSCIIFSLSFAFTAFLASAIIDALPPHENSKIYKDIEGEIRK